MARTEWDRDHKYPDPVLKINYIETVLPTLGFVTDQQGAKGMSGVRIAAHLRELERASPTLLLKAVDDPQERRRHGPAKAWQGIAASNLVDGGWHQVQGPLRFQDPSAAAIRTRDDDNVARRFRLRSRARRLEGGRRRQGGVRAVLPGQRRRGREAHL